MTDRDISKVRILCSPDDEPRVREILEAWPADEGLPFGLAVEDEGNYRRLTATDGHSYGYILLTRAQWETLVHMGGRVAHLARVLGAYAARAGA